VYQVRPAGFPERGKAMSRIKRIAVAVVTAGAIGTLGAAPAWADAPNGNSGHNSNGDTQCQNSDSNPYCPPVGR